MILLTGAAGYLGSHIFHEFKKRKIFYPKNLNYRNVMFYQWANEELDLDGYNFNNSYVLAFDKWDIFSKTLYK